VVNQLIADLVFDASGALYRLDPDLSIHPMVAGVALDTLMSLPFTAAISFLAPADFHSTRC
jgi:hypothetical protein